MTHIRTVIEPAEGLTILTGPNNCGKSAVVLALQCLNTNDRDAKRFIRHGQKEAKITVETSEGSRISFTRTPTYSTYQINEREITRTRRPEDLDEHLRCALVTGGETRDVKFDLHFADQKSPIFLVGGKGADAATFFAASSDAGYMLEMQKVLATKTADVRGDKRRSEERVAVLEKQAAAFANLAESEQRVRKAEDAHHALLELRNRISSLRETIVRLDESEVRRDLLEAESKILVPLTSPPSQVETGLISRVCLQMRVLSFTREMHSKRADSLSKLRIVPELTDPGPLSHLVHDIKAKTDRIKLISRKAEVVNKMPLPPDQTDIQPLVSMLSALQAHCLTIANLQQEEATVCKSQSEFAELAREWVQQHPNCPTCGGKLSAEQILEHLEPSHA